MKQLFSILLTFILSCSFAASSYAAAPELYETVLTLLEEDSYGGAYYFDTGLHIHPLYSQEQYVKDIIALAEQKTNTKSNGIIFIESPVAYSLTELEKGLDKTEQAYFIDHPDAGVSLLATNEKYNALEIHTKTPWTEQQKQEAYTITGIDNIIFSSANKETIFQIPEITSEVLHQLDESMHGGVYYEGTVLHINPVFSQEEDVINIIAAAEQKTNMKNKNEQYIVMQEPVPYTVTELKNALELAKKAYLYSDTHVYFMRLDIKTNSLFLESHTSWTEQQKQEAYAITGIDNIIFFPESPATLHTTIVTLFQKPLFS